MLNRILLRIATAAGGGIILSIIMALAGAPEVAIKCFILSTALAYTCCTFAVINTIGREMDQ